MLVFVEVACMLCIKLAHFTELLSTLELSCAWLLLLLFDVVRGSAFMSHYVFSGVNFILICFLLLKCLLLCDHVTLCLLGYTVCEAADNLKRLGL